MAVKFSNYEEMYTRIVNELFMNDNVTYTVSDNHIKFSGIDENEQLLNWLGHYAFTYNVLVDITVSTGLLTKTYTKTRFRSFGGDEAVIVFGDIVTKETSFDEKINYVYKNWANEHKSLTVDEFEDYKDVFDFLNADIRFTPNGVYVTIPKDMSCSHCKYQKRSVNIASPWANDYCLKNKEIIFNKEICRHYENGIVNSCHTCKHNEGKGQYYFNCSVYKTEIAKTNCENWERKNESIS